MVINAPEWNSLAFALMIVHWFEWTSFNCQKLSNISSDGFKKPALFLENQTEHLLSNPV